MPARFHLYFAGRLGASLRGRGTPRGRLALYRQATENTIRVTEAWDPPFLFRAPRAVPVFIPLQAPYRRFAIVPLSGPSSRLPYHNVAFFSFVPLPFLRGKNWSWKNTMLLARVAISGMSVFYGFIEQILKLLSMEACFV